MNLKCVLCEGEAEYLVKGTSYCKEHLPTENKPQDTQVENLDILESRVNKAIEDGCSFEFDMYDIYQTKFMQKVAETKSSWFGTYLTPIILFFAAVGVSFAVGGMSVLFSIRDISLIDSGKMVLFIFIGLLLLLFSKWYASKWEPQFKTCDKIILNAERRIQTLIKEKEKK